MTALNAEDLVTVRVTERSASPGVFRKFVVPRRLALEDLHRVIQVAFGWNPETPFEFFMGTGTKERSIFDLWNPVDPKRYAMVSMEAFVGLGTGIFRHVYDFIRWQEHSIRLLKRIPKAPCWTCVATRGPDRLEPGFFRPAIPVPSEVPRRILAEVVRREPTLRP